jgi:FkbM family methyltransferase
VFKLPSPYQLKKTLLYPRKIYMRHKENLEPGFMRSALELHYYRPAFYKWLKDRSANEHLLHEADIGPKSVVLDVGAYIGEWAQEITNLYDPAILAFEPDPRNFKQLEQRAQDNAHLTPYRYGLGEKNEKVLMKLEYMGSSVISHDTENNEAPSASAEIRDIFDTWNTLALERVDLMKINIEGGEFSLLERMIETGLIKKVDCYLIQFHEWHPGAYRRRRMIRKAMGKTHRLVWDYHFVWEKWVTK